tara:strand:- start:57 stop:629 length:573 start_codon:yes stop_codon:yes gene_type:complete
MAWVKGLSRQAQLAAMRGKAEGRVAMAKVMLGEGFSPAVVRWAVREHLGVSTMTAYRDVRVALGGDRSEKRSSMILRGWPDPPPEEVFAAAICLADTDLEAIGWSPPAGAVLAARQLEAGAGTAFRALLSDEEARIAISLYWRDTRRTRSKLSDVSAFQTSDTKSGRMKAGTALKRYAAARGRIDRRWRK